MILQSLADYYEALAARGEIARPGWGKAKIAFALELDKSGKLTRVVPLSSPSPDGKKLIPQTMELPAPVKRTVGIDANFLWDNSAYLLGIDGKGKPERAQECFKAAKDMHVSLLSASDDPFARAISGFFAGWEPDHAADEPVLADSLDIPL